MLVVGIAGGTASGKTTLVTQILATFDTQEISVISQDDYYKKTDHLSIEARKKINFDHPDAIDFDLLEQHLQALRLGHTIYRPVYSFIHHNREVETVRISPSKILILEGILILSQPGIRALIDLKVFLDIEADERLIRRLRRDTIVRGRTMEDIIDRYLDSIKPMHEKFIAPTKTYADLMLTHAQPLSEMTGILKQHILTCLD